VLARSEDAWAAGRRAVEIAGIGHVNERMPLAAREHLHALDGGKEAARRAYAEAGVTTGDVTVAEVHDCFTIAQLLCTEALGLSRDGRAGFGLTLALRRPAARAADRGHLLGEP